MYWRVERHEALDEAAVECLMNVNALDATAALPRIEERPVDGVLDRVLEAGVGTHVGRVLAAQLEPDGGEGACRRALDGAPALDATGESHMIDHAIADDQLGAAMVSTMCWNTPLG